MLPLRLARTIQACSLCLTPVPLQKVASVLLEYGSLNLHTLIRYSKLPEKIVKQTLVVLIQLHLVVHSSQPGGRNDDVVYECAWMQIYELLHAGKMIAAVEERFGADGAYVVNNMLQMGHVRVSDFLAGTGLGKVIKTAKGAKGMKDQPPAAAGDAANGLGAAPAAQMPATLAALKSVMTEMRKRRYLVQVQEHHMRPETDVVNEVRLKLTKQIRESHAAMSDLKLRKLVDAQLATKLRELELGDLSEHAGLKKRMAHFEAAAGKRPSKRAKLSTSFEDVNGIEAVWEIDVGASCLSIMSREILMVLVI